MLNLRTSFLSCLLLLIVNASLSYGGEIWVVGSEQSSLNSVSNDILEGAFLRKPYSGEKLTPIDRVDVKSDCRSRFYQTVVGKSITQLKAYWSAFIFTGKGYPPHSAHDISEIKKIFDSNPTAITFIDPSEKESWMKVLSKIPTTP